MQNLQPTTYIISIAVSDYQYYPKLSNAVNDSNGIIDILEQYLRHLADNFLDDVN